MSQVVFGLFTDRARAEKAIHHIREAVDEDKVSVLLREEPEYVERLSVSETDSKHGLKHGALVGAIVGALAASLLVGPLGIIGAGPLAAAVIGAGGGSIFGALGSGLAGLGMPDRTIRAWSDALEEGAVIVSVISDGPDHLQTIESLMVAQGASQVERSTTNRQ